MRFAIHVAQDLLERVSFANYKLAKECDAMHAASGS